MRRDARILCFSLVFERLFNSNPVDEELWTNLNEKDRALAEEIFSAYLSHKEEINSAIKQLVKGYEFDRLHKVDLALLSIAIAEIEYLSTPAPVVINEVIEIAKTYSSIDAPKFLNGVLGSYVKSREGKDA